MEFLKSIVFWDMTPCSPLSFNRRFGGTYGLHLQGRRNIPEDDTLHNHGCENLKSYNQIFLCLFCELFLIIVVIIKQNVGQMA
jgi:hypothetical protein